MQQILQGDCIESMRGMEAGSVHCCVTSPPYWGLRDYGCDGQLGLESTPDEFIAGMVRVFAEVRRVLRDDGTLWLNMGDSFHEKQLQMIPARLALALQADGWYLRSEIIWAKGVSFCADYSGSVMPESCRDRPTSAHEKLYLLSKSPRYHYDQEAVRERSVYPDDDRKARTKTDHKRMPSAKVAGVRPGSATYAGRNLRNVWTINPQPYAEAHFATFPEALVRPCIQAGSSEKGACPECGAPWERVVERDPNPGGIMGKGNDRHASSDMGARVRDSKREAEGFGTRTTGWQPTCECLRKDERGYQVLLDGTDQDLPTPIPSTVLDPFAGSGTTLAVAAKLGRDAIGCELNPEYIALAEKRIALALNCCETGSLL